MDTCMYTYIHSTVHMTEVPCVGVEHGVIVVPVAYVLRQAHLPPLWFLVFVFFGVEVV